VYKRQDIYSYSLDLRGEYAIISAGGKAKLSRAHR
jgi:hypothetical protein